MKQLSYEISIFHGWTTYYISLLTDWCELIVLIHVQDTGLNTNKSAKNAVHVMHSSRQDKKWRRIDI